MAKVGAVALASALTVTVPRALVITPTEVRVTGKTSLQAP
jgi:hypothetical protein